LPQVLVYNGNNNSSLFFSISKATVSAALPVEGKKSGKVTTKNNYCEN